MFHGTIVCHDVMYATINMNFKSDRVPGLP